MKILLISAGQKIKGASERAVCEAEKQFKINGAECDKFYLRSEPIATCSGCNHCKASGKCVHNDIAAHLAKILDQYDGYVFFTPVHYGGAAGVMKAALSRIFYLKKSAMEYKPAAAVAISRRGGNLTTLEEITRFFSFSSMPCVNGNYPGIIHGSNYEEAERDEEGLQTIRSIADNMVWLINCIKGSKIPCPNQESKIKTDFIR